LLLVAAQQSLTLVLVETQYLLSWLGHLQVVLLLAVQRALVVLLLVVVLPLVEGLTLLAKTEFLALIHGLVAAHSLTG
jgi:hypothetical protein